MGAEIVNFSGGVLTLKVSGKLTQAELASVQKAAGEIIEKQGKCRILVLTENFAGWERGGAWSDQSFQAAHDASIERMAIVGDRKWEDLALLLLPRVCGHSRSNTSSRDNSLQPVPGWLQNSGQRSRLMLLGGQNATSLGLSMTPVKQLSACL